MSNPAPNSNVPQIPQPLADVGALANVAQALKQGMDSLGGHRGSTLDRAVTFRDLVNLKLVAPGTFPSATVVAGGTSTGTGSGTQPSVVNPYVLSGFAPQVLTANQVVFGHQFPIQVTFAANFAPIAIGMFSEVGCFIAATGTPVLTVERCLAAADPTASGNWSTVGTITFTGHTANLATTGGAAAVFATGDYMRVRGPATPDATLAQLFMCLVGKR